MKAAKKWLGVFIVLTAMGVNGGDGWQVQVGGVHQWGMTMKTRGSALTTPHNYSIPPGVLPGQDAAGVGLADPNNQTYVDGYVRRDLWMDIPGAPEIYQNMTWNWSYNSYAEQYNASDQTLAFHRQVEQAAGISSETEKFSATGVELSARRDLWSCGGLIVGIDLDVAWFPDMNVSQSRSATSRYHTYYYSDNYDGTGVVPGLPDAYQGPDYYNGGGADVPPINYTPIRITDTIEMHTVSTEAELYRVRGGIGPTLQYPITDKLSLYATPQFTLSLAHANVKRTQLETSETTTISGSGGTTTSSLLNETSNDKTAIMAGFLLAAGLDYKFAPNWVLGAYVGHEWIPRDLRVSNGSEETSLNLGGGEVSCYVGMKF